MENLYHEKMGKNGHIKTLPVDYGICNNKAMDLEQEKGDIQTDIFGLRDSLDDSENNSIYSSDDDGTSDDNFKRDYGACYEALGDTEDDEPYSVPTIVDKSLTAENINKLNDLLDAIEFSIEHDINIDELETVEECKERFLLHIQKERNEITKKQQVIIIIIST